MALCSVPPGVTSPPLGQVQDCDFSHGSPSPFPLGLLPCPALEVSGDWRAFFFPYLPRGRVDFLGVSGLQEVEARDLSISAAIPFWSLVNFQAKSLASLGLGWAWVLGEGLAQILREGGGKRGVTLLNETGPTTLPGLPCLRLPVLRGPLPPAAPWAAGSREREQEPLPWPAWQETCPNRLSPGREAEIKALGV